MCSFIIQVYARTFAHLAARQLSTVHYTSMWKRNGLFWKTNKPNTQLGFFSDGKNNSISWSDWQFKYLSCASALTRPATLHDFADTYCMWNLKLSRRSFGVSSWIFGFFLYSRFFPLLLNFSAWAAVWLRLIWARKSLRLQIISKFVHKTKTNLSNNYLHLICYISIRYSLTLLRQ